MSTTGSTGSPLEERFFLTDAARWQRTFPWLRVFRTFRIAVDYRRVLLAIVALLLWSAGDWTLERAGLGEQPPTTSVAPEQTEQTTWPWEAGYLPPHPAAWGRARLALFVEQPIAGLQAALSNGAPLLFPMQRVFDAATETAWSDTPREFFGGALRCFWASIVIAIFGSAASRMAAVECAGHGDGAAFVSLRYARQHLTSYLGALWLPAVGLFGLWVICAGGGLIGSIPVIGETVLGIFWFIPLICGLLMTLILIGVAIGWPLMICAISVEGSDAFDALSRAYCYLFNRAGYAAFLIGVALLYGSILLYLVSGVTMFAVDVTVWAVSFGLGNPHDGFTDHPAFIVWMQIVACIPAAFCFSYFWTAFTSIYLLLRLREDATPYTQLGAPTDDVNTSFAEPPLVGVPAAERREAASNESPPPTS